MDADYEKTRALRRRPPIGNRTPLKVPPYRRAPLRQRAPRPHPSRPYRRADHSTRKAPSVLTSAIQRGRSSAVRFTLFSLIYDFFKIRSDRRLMRVIGYFQWFRWWAHKDSNLGPAD